MYFSVSPLKLVIMSICTGGLYDLYWIYKNWERVKQREGIDIKPFWRGVFGILFGYKLLRKIQVSANNNQINKTYSSFLLSVIWMLMILPVKIPDPYSIIIYFSALPLVPVQIVINQLNETLDPNHKKNNHFTLLNMLAIIVGGSLFLSDVMGLFGFQFPFHISF
ncbi:MAG: hypothetical protein AB7I41_10040 [Candidatus Sericytochromatia bacterium]|jgi:hypothetical protein